MMEVDDESAEARLVKACRAGDLQTVEALLRSGTRPNPKGGVDIDVENTPLLSACLTGSLPVVRLLLEAAAQADLEDAEGKGVALYAAESGSVELLAWLLEQGLATLAECATDGSTALLCAAGGGTLAADGTAEEGGGAAEMVAWLLSGPPGAMAAPSTEERDERGADALLTAAEAGNIAVIRELLQRGVRVDTVDDHGCCALHFAAAGGNVAAAAFCVESLGIPCAARDNDGDTPLIVAAHEGRTLVVEWLLQHGSKAADRNRDGMSAAMAAAAGEHTAIIDLLSRYSGDDGDHWMGEIEMHPELVLNYLEKGAKLG